MLEFDRISPPLPQALASALRRLAHIAHTSSWDKWASHGLTPTQRKILSFLESHREALSVSTVAAELGVTPATASESVTSLEAKGLLRKRRSHADGRAITVVLTAEGKEALAALSGLPDPLQAAFAALSSAEQEAFYRLAIKMIRNLQETGVMPVTRMCVRCKYFDPFRYPDSATPHHCHLVGAPFADRHLRIDCPDQIFNEADAQKAIWIRFNAGPAAPPEPERVVPARGAGGRASGRRRR
jgi:DNA-binding MarR family transcriptional regulator